MTHMRHGRKDQHTDVLSSFGKYAFLGLTVNRRVERDGLRRGGRAGWPDIDYVGSEFWFRLMAAGAIIQQPETTLLALRD